MAKKISQLTQATEVKSDDVTVIVQDGETKKLPLNMMVTKQDIENKKVAGLAKLDEIETTYENDTYTPTIAVKNKSSVKVGEGDGVDYSANVMDGHVKSAILKGNTMVNIAQITSHNFDNYRTPVQDLNKSLEIGKQYTIIVNIVSQTVKLGFTLRFGKNNSFVGIKTFNGVGLHKFLYNATNDFNQIAPYIELSEWNEGLRLEYNQLMIIEGDYTKIDVPYFEGMQSVKMPVLTTTGKNLFDESQAPEQSSWGDNIKKANVKENTTYVYSSSPYTGYVSFKFYDNNDNEIGQGISITSGTSFTTPPNTSYLKTHTSNVSLVQIEEGSTATTYEPYKSNILTVNEDVELRGIGDVKDTLDLTTNEVVERIGEIVLDGSDDENWSFNKSLGDGSYNQFIFASAVNAKKVAEQLVVCDKLVSNMDENLNNVIWIYDGRTMVIHSSCASANELKSWLQSNPITVQYELATESIKTVDLMPSGTHPSTTPYCWKNGHIQLSSSGLLPNLEYSVVTSRAGQINQNATMIVKNDKRIFDLEILLAGGLVNTTYQALTLQNQVETGLSKVSLNSETEPDYLLYHMIMKLIEEKAYKLDDLTEKVSVFYLYEKLSDEQFETIYSALYPFAEDEIIEEPVVEELPEAVEDEVIM